MNALLSPGFKSIKLSELLSKANYYNISAFLLCCQNDFGPLIEIYGERQAFIYYRNILALYHECVKIENMVNSPMILSNDLRIVDWHWHVASMILAGKKSVYYLACEQPAPDYGMDWVGNYTNKDKLINYYEKIPEIWGLD